MKKILLLMPVIAALCSTQCGKKSNNVGPDDTTPGNVGTFVILSHGISSFAPNQVNVLCNVIDTSGAGADFLTADRFVIKENGTAVDAKKAGLAIRKRNTLNYHVNTILLLDVSTGVGLDALKQAASAFVNALDPMQSIAIYTFSSTLNLAQELTQNSAQLNNAINGITAGSADRNLYGAIGQAFTRYNELISVGEVDQNLFVVFTAGNDNKNEKTKEEIINSTQFTHVYTIGLGNNLDQDFLKQAGNRGYYLVSDPTQITQAFTQTQNSILKFADSFYRIGYQSSLRGAGSQEIELSITANAYNGKGSKMKGLIDASIFKDVKGLAVNWTPVKPEGIDTLVIGVNVPRSVKVYSQGNLAPVFEWSCLDAGIASIEAISGDNASFSLRGAAEGNTLLIIRDTANALTDTVVVQSVQSHGGYVLREWWLNLSGTSIGGLTSNPAFPEFPSGRQYINKMEGPQSFGDSYGTRFRGFVCPTVSGAYSFWIASDDASQLFFSLSENPDQKTMIARADSWTAYQGYDTYASQHSADFQLEAGKFYYIEALHKEGGGGDNVSIAWQGPGIARGVIPSQNLSAWLGD